MKKKTTEKQFPCRILEGHESEVNCVAVTPDGRKAVSGARDKTVRIWDLDSGHCLAVLKGHMGIVRGVAVTGDGKRLVSGSYDSSVRIWDLKSSHCFAVLKGHRSDVNSVVITSDEKKVISGSDDRTVRVWDLESGRCLAALEGHMALIRSVAVTENGKRAISGSYDGTIRTWDLKSGRCLAVLVGHKSWIKGVAVTADGKWVVSGADNGTVRVWDLESKSCLAVLEGHTSAVWDVAVTADGERVFSGSSDGTIRVWDLKSGQCLAVLEGHKGSIYGVAVTANGKRVVSGSGDGSVRVWDLTSLQEIAKAEESARYTNAKVVLAGKTGAGKTGLALRLCEDHWEVTESTHGMIVSQLPLPKERDKSGLDREVWLWDFAGQPDYRLIHQLYMDETALGVLVFDPQDDNPFEDIGHWEKALRTAGKYEPAKLLVAARCDRGGITVSQKRFDQFIKEHGFAGFLSTGAKIGEGCEELKAEIAKHIPWDRLPWTATTRQFKALKDAILKLQEEKTPLIQMKELQGRLEKLLPGEAFNEEELRAVVGLMQGQGVVQKLAFGDFVLLQPEWINNYASVVVRMAREHVDEIGTVPEQQVLDGRLEYKKMPRLPEAEEKILLRAMVQTFIERALCLREDTLKGKMLVFPSYFRRDRPDIPEYPNVFVTYGFSGALDDIYATLVVKLNYSKEFDKDQLWKDAADFKAAGGKRVGLAMINKKAGAAQIVVYFDKDVPDDTKVTFIKYIHEHLLAKAEDVTRVRSYVCPHCNEPVESRRAIERRLEKGETDIACVVCDERIPLIDLIEEKFASDEFLQRVRKMDARANINIDNESRELILVGQAFSIAGEAGQIFRPTANSDWGIDGEIEFKNKNGEASAERVYLQLKSGDSYLYERKRDEKEIFTIRNPRHAEYWQSHKYPVMLVIRTSDGTIRWMNVTEYLRKHGKKTKQIIFEGEPFTAENLIKMRDELLRGK